MDAEQTPDGGAAPEQSPTLPTLAQRLDRCMRVMHAPDRGDWTYQEVADGTRAISEEGAWSSTYVHKVRTGGATNPRLSHLRTLAAFFHVPITYFIGDDEQVKAIDAEIEFIQAMRNPAVQDIALRATHLTPSGLRAVTQIINELAAANPQPKPGRGRSAAQQPDRPTD